MGMAEKIRIVLVKKKMNISQLAETLGTSQSNLSKKLKRDNFSEKELQDIAAALNVGFESYFVLEEGERI